MIDRDLHPEPDASVTTLVSGIISDAQALLEQQFELLKHEVRKDLRKTREAGQVAGLGIGFGFVGAVLIGFMAANLLAWAQPTIPLWACYGICGGVMLTLGILLWWVGMAKFNSFHPLEDGTAQTLKENVQWISNPK